MPFLFSLPTTSTLSFTRHYTSSAYSSLPLTCTTYRGILRDALKQHKRLATAAQNANLKHIISVTTEYLGYVLFLYDSIQSGLVARIPEAPELETEWRSVLTATSRFGAVRELPRRKWRGIEYEVFWVLSTLAYANALQSRALLLEFLSTSPGSAADNEARSKLIPQSIDHLLTSASIFDYLLTLPSPAQQHAGGTAGESGKSKGAEKVYETLPIDLSEQMISSLSSACLASATLLAVLKSDPYPSYLALTTNSSKSKSNDACSKDYLYQPPAPPTGVKALLFSRICIAASEYASKAQGAISSLISQGEVSSDYVRYLEGLKRASRARGCRFLGIDAEAQGRVGEGLGWIRLGREIIGVQPSASESSENKENGNKEKKSLSSRMDKLRLSKKSTPSIPTPSASSSSSSASGSSGGLAPYLDPCNIHSEYETLNALDTKWTNLNNKVMFQPILSPKSLTGKIPSGRKVHNVKVYTPPTLGPEIIEKLKGNADGSNFGDDYSVDRQQVNDDDAYWRGGGGGGGNGVDSSDEDTVVDNERSNMAYAGQGGYY